MTAEEHRMFDEFVSASESGRPDAELTSRFERLLVEHPEALEAWIEHCQLCALLEADDVVAAALMRDGMPGNVVSLPNPLPRQPASTVAGSLGGEVPSAVCGSAELQSPGNRRRLARLVAAVAITAALVGLAWQPWRTAWQSMNGLSDGPSGTAGDKPASVPIPHPERGADGRFAAGPDRGAPPASAETEDDSRLARESDYQRMLLAGHEPGSLNRPPTPFESTQAGGAVQKISFNRDIRPILSDNCVECHGPDGAGRKADLRLDLESEAVTDVASFESGESTAPVVRGRSDLSDLIARIETDDLDDLMPPPDSHKALTVQQIELLKRWVEEGAEWEEHWAFVAPRRPLPDGEDPAEARGEENEDAGSAPAPVDFAGDRIDQLVRERLDEAGLEPSPEADRRTLIRRVTLDLIGLPPTPDEVAAFVEDPADTDVAYARVVDRLLASPHYGEHRGRYWLDAARYADTHGLHLDNYREMWPYRDWVIAAFNRNQPFDQFTIEQLAGDLLDDPSQEQLVATGFNRCNVTTSEGGAIAEEFESRYAIDRVSTTSTVWLGLTTGCAQCHDHKYDPVTMREFYQLLAYFNNTTQQAMDKNVPDTPPVIRVYADADDKAEEQRLKEALAAADETVKQAAKNAEEAFQAWVSRMESNTSNPPVLQHAGPVGQVASGFLDREQGTLELASTDASTFALRRGEPFTIVMKLKAPQEIGVFPLLSQIDPSGRGFRVTLDLRDEALELALFGEGGDEGPGGALKVRHIQRFKPGGSYHVALLCDGSGEPGGVRVYVEGRDMERRRFPYLEHDDLRGDYSVAGAPPVRLEDAEGILEELRLFDRELTAEEVTTLNGGTGRIVAILKKPADKRSKEEVKSLRSHFMVTEHEDYQLGLMARAEADSALDAFHRRVPVTHVMNEADGMASAHILDRGEYDQPLEEVAPGVPEILPPLPEDAPANRLGLARWLVSSDHPLTARVTVNRFWQQFFGVGLVKTSGDFGTQGEPPSHPELLDWLAVDFIESGWDVKHVIRQIVLSDTYRQSSRITPDLLARDPENRLLARGPRFRLDAEVIRDQALAVGGLLVGDIGGAPVRPYQPDGLWKAVGYSNSNTVKFARHHGERLYRRSIYTFWKRTAPPPNMTAFDAPDRESCTVSRERTNTPLQALVLMNDEQFVEAARHLAQAGLAASGDPLDTMSLRALGRPLDSAERTIIDAALAEFRRHYASDPEAAIALLGHGDQPVPDGLDPAELAALTLTASQLLNLDEVITKH